MVIRKEMNTNTDDRLGDAFPLQQDARLLCVYAGTPSVCLLRPPFPANSQTVFVYTSFTRYRTHGVMN